MVNNVKINSFLKSVKKKFDYVVNLFKWVSKSGKFKVASLKFQDERK